MNPSAPTRYAIVTTTAGPSRARFEPMYHGTPVDSAPVLDPLIKAPPWRNTSTGRFTATPTEVVQMLSVRQSSSPMVRCKSGLFMSTCTHIAPYSVALRIREPHASGGSGGAQRRDPTGGFANGTPLYTQTPCASIVPRSLPCGMPIRVGEDGSVLAQP